MYKVEYLLLVDGKQASCRTVGSLMHLLQSDSDIEITENGKQIIYKGTLHADLEVLRGNAETDGSESSQSVYFDIQLICRSIKDLQGFSSLLRAIRKVTTPVLISPAAFQVLWDDLSAYYASKAYPLISATENRMRKLITKFMHINVGIAWTEDRIPDDVQKSISLNKSDSTYLYNVDFIKLKDMLLSESFIKHRDALIKELRTSTKAKFMRDEIKALIPTSNWERYFSEQVGISSNELASLWDKLYDLRCKVAHNKAFTLIDLTSTRELTKRVNQILDEAIEGLDVVHVDKDEARDIVDEVVTTTSRENSRYTGELLAETRKLYDLVFSLSTPLHDDNKEKRRSFREDLAKLLATGFINDSQYQKIKRASQIRNSLVHNFEDSATSGDLEAYIRDYKEIVSHLEKVRSSLRSSNEGEKLMSKS